MASHSTTFNTKGHGERRDNLNPKRELVSKQRITKYATYVQRKTTARSRNCYGNATMGYFCIAVQLYATVNNVKGFGAAMEVQQWVLFAEMSTIPRARVLRLRF